MNGQKINTWSHIMRPLKKAEIKNISYVYFLRPQCGHINIHLEQPLNIPFKQPLLGVITIWLSTLSTLCRTLNICLNKFFFFKLLYIFSISFCNLFNVLYVIIKLSFYCKSSIIVFSTIDFLIIPLWASLPNII